VSADRPINADVPIAAEVALLERDRPRRSFRRLTQEDVESRAGEPAS